VKKIGKMLITNRWSFVGVLLDRWSHALCFKHRARLCCWRLAFKLLWWLSNFCDGFSNSGTFS